MSDPSGEAVRAALLETIGQPLRVVDDVLVAPPGPGQVKVRVGHCGLCHSDLTIMEGAGQGMIPAILGHEAAGVVEEVGAGVRTLAPGDKVLLAPLAPCGRCYWCVRGEHAICQEAMFGLGGGYADGSTPLTRNGVVVTRGVGVGGFSELVINSESGAVKIAPETPLEIAAVIGCAVQTGVGAVLNTARVEPGATVLVMGLGGIGISVVQGARIAGAAQIIVSDPVPERRDAAARFGATHALDSKTTDITQAAYELTGGIGVDYAFDAFGNAGLLETGLRATRRGGMTVGVGVAKGTEMVSTSAIGLVMQEKKLVGSVFGSSNPHREVPRMLSFWRAGQLDLEGMISRRRPLEEINEGFDDMRAGRGIRTVLDIS
jgi:S-(hydroxymethyl)glutathione dehydrogenase/alcohol dehydrogenase